jgi:Periplasmic binding protein
MEGRGTTATGRRNALLLLVLIAALTVGLTACGSSGGSSSSSTSTAGTEGSEEAPAGGGGAEDASDESGAEVKIGTLIPLTGTGLNFPDYLAGAKAAVLAINEEGGINGHKIDLQECDDRNDPNQANVCAHELAGSGAIAVAGGVSLFGAQEAEILKSASLPWIGALPIVAQETELSNEYPIESGNIGNYGTTGTFAKQAGQKSLAGFVLEGPLGEAAAEALEKGAEVAGIPYKGTVYVPIDATDYAPYVQKIEALDAEAVGTQLAAAQFLLLATASAEANAEWQMYQSAVGIAPNIFEQVPKEELPKITAMSAVPPADTAIESEYPGIGEYIADMEAYEQKTHDPNGTPQNYTSGSITSWQALEATAKVAEGVPSGSELDAASFLEALEKSGPVDTGLGTPWDPPPPLGPSEFPQVTNGTEFTWSLKTGTYTLAAPEPLEVIELLNLK